MGKGHNGEFMRKVAVVVPCFNEAASLLKLHETLTDELTNISSGDSGKAVHFDIVFVNDGSNDESQAIINRLAREFKVHYIELASNAGHQAALMAGLTAVAKAKYDSAVMLDADMQHPPRYIKDMIIAWDKGYKIVQMVRNDNASQAGGLKYITSKLYYRLLRGLSGIDLVYGSSDFRLIDKTILRQLIAIEEPNLFLRGYFASIKVRTKVISYLPDKRYSGESKYTIKKMFTLAREGIVQFSVRPLYISIGLGALSALAGVLYGLYLIVQNLQGAYQVSGWSSIMVAMLFLAGINFMLLGVIGLYLAQNIRITRGRPDFIIASSTFEDSVNS